ncbi:MAG TPA: hypothetical protein VN256_23025 [Pyrinomonadaceae bacterium]|nr:hypothetical protein [Pyrinomonadaceae bacterium]
MKKIDWGGEQIMTGAIQFGDDLPGLFIRGGECIGLSTAVQRLLECIGADTLQRNPVLLECLMILNELRETIERDDLVRGIITHVTRRNKCGIDIKCLKCNDEPP